MPSRGVIMEFADLKSQYQALAPVIDARIRKVLSHGQFIMGPEVVEMEQQLAQFTGTKHCISCSSGTDALLIALMALGLKPGDEVITTPFTFVATAEMIVLLGARPVFVDIEPDTCNIDAAAIEAAITPRTRAVMPVSLYGQPADMDAINHIASRRSLAVIEDAAQSFGATYNGKPSCNLSTVACTSFFPSKPLGCYGDGGALFTNDGEVAQAMQEIRVHGQERRYYHTRIGIGGRMDTLQCAIVLAKLERFEWEIAARQRIATRYDLLLAPLAERIALPCVRSGRTSAWAQYTVRVSERDALQAALKESRIPTAVHYPVPLHRQPAYRHCGVSGELQQADRAANQVLSLPMSADLSAIDQDRVAEALILGLARAPALAVPPDR